MLISSSVTQKHQATIPLAIRQKLGLHAGDRVAFDINDYDQVIIRKADPLELGYYDSLNATMSEWHSKNDDEAYNDL